MNDSHIAHPERDLTAKQHEVQRLLGRCVLRLQQYERLMKNILVNHDFTTVGSSPEPQRPPGTSRLATANLGSLVKLLFESVVVLRDPKSAPSEEEDDDFCPPAVPTIQTRIRHEMTAVDLATTKSAVKELVDLRNMLVHHFIEKFDVWTVDGCDGAAAHLAACYGRIDTHFEQLRQWSVSMSEASAAAAAFMQSDAFLDFVVDGIAPDGTVDWSSAGIVRCLREATSAAGPDGWTSLAAAIASIERAHPEQVPERYGCRSWPQVLDDSRTFDIRYQGNERSLGNAMYRQRKIVGS